MHKQIITDATRRITTQAYIRPCSAELVGKDWQLYGEAELRYSVARDVMAQYAYQSVEQLTSSLLRIYARAQSAQRAAATPVCGVGSQLSAMAVRPLRTCAPYSVFPVEEHDLSFPKFDGTQSKVVTRGALVSSDAASVMPYDPVRDSVFLVEQFRAGPHVRGDGQPWCFEPIVGLIDESETPENAATREAKEEVGLDIRHLEMISQNYPSPGLSTEFFYLYIGLVGLPEVSNVIAGLASESENTAVMCLRLPNLCV